MKPHYSVTASKYILYSLPLGSYNDSFDVRTNQSVCFAVAAKKWKAMFMIAGFLKMIFGRSGETFVNRRKLRLAMHQARFVGSLTNYFFIFLTNLSQSREIKLTYVWCACSLRIPVIQTGRPLPKRLKPDESFETSVETGTIPSRLWSEAFTLASVRLANGQILRSRKNDIVPKAGTVAGGAIQNR